MNVYKKEEFITMLTTYIDKLQSETLTPDEGLLLIEFFAKDKIKGNSTTLKDTQQDLLEYAFIGYYIKQLCRDQLTTINHDVVVD
jgi:hypothetical protein